MNNLVYANGRAIVSLNGISSKKLTLPVVAAGTNPAAWQNCEWSPEDKGVHDLEVRAFISAAVGTLGSFVRVLWYAEIGVADSGEFREPLSTPAAAASGTLIRPNWMPDRGMVLRINARRLKLGFRCELLSGAAESVQLMVGIQPTSTGPDTPRFPAVTGGLLSQRLAVPAYASEWRFRNSVTGLAFGAGSLTGFSCLAGLAGPVLLADLADFAPIGLPMQSYTCTDNHLVEYR